jgi:hypothetical protein
LHLYSRISDSVSISVSVFNWKYSKKCYPNPILCESDPLPSLAWSTGWRKYITELSSLDSGDLFGLWREVGGAADCGVVAGCGRRWRLAGAEEGFGFGVWGSWVWGFMAGGFRGMVAAVRKSSGGGGLRPEGSDAVKKSSGDGGLRPEGSEAAGNGAVGRVV